ncbi:MAG TPA: MMPL family transporter [Dermatophilaceae bacterium]|nr:MMPL family transporter [Dermatophilaceae bacterium]
MSSAPPTTTRSRHRHRTGSGLPRWIRLASLLVVVAWLGIAGVGGPAVGKLSATQENDIGSALPKDAPSSLARQESAAFSQGQGFPFFMVVTRPGGLQPSDPATVQAMLADLPGRDLGAKAATRTVGDLLAEPPRAVVPSADKEALFIPISLDADKSSERIGEQDAVALAAAAIRTAARESLNPSGLQVVVTGPAAFVADIGSAFAGIDVLLLLVALGVVFVILLIVYRSPILPFAVLLSAVFGLAAAALVVYPLANNGVLQVNGQSQGILSILVVGAATDYALLLVARYREELHLTERAWVAMKRAWRGTVEPIAASAATVILGLLCLLLADLGSTRSLGPISAVGIVGALLGALTFLPAVLLLAGRRVFWPRIPRVDNVHAEDVLGTRGMWGRIAAIVGAHPRRVWVITAALLVAAAAFAPTLKADGLTQAQIFRTSVEYVDGEKVLAQHFPGGTGSPAQMVVPQESAAQVADIAATTPGVQKVVVGQSPGVPPVVVDGKVIVQATLADPPESPAAEETILRLRDTLSQVQPTPNVGGVSATALDTRQTSTRDNRVVMPSILAVVLLVLILLLRSLVGPVLLVLANILSFLATLGVAALVFNHLFDFPNADPATPLYGFVFLIALGIDYSIFLMTRVREETPRRGTKQAALVGLAVTGGVITSAGVVLAATFSSLIILPLVFMAQIAFLVAFGVLLDTIVVRSLLVPGLVGDLGHRIWWPSRLDRPDAAAQPPPQRDHSYST